MNTTKYESKKKIKVGDKEFSLTKTEDQVKLTDGKKKIFEGTPQEFQRWLKDIK